MKKTIEEIRDYLLENAVDEDGDLMLNGLDFSDFEGDVFIEDLKVKGDLYQDYQKVKGNLYQDDQEVQGNLFHGNSKYGGELIEYPYSKILKEITTEELKEMGYELV